MFQNVDQNLGKVKEGTKHTLEFPFSGIRDIISTTASCGCSVSEVNKDKSALIVNYTAKQVPPHLWGQGFYQSCLVINVTYTTLADPNTHNTQKLTFSVTVIR